jgi:hypothetical protein
MTPHTKGLIKSPSQCSRFCCLPTFSPGDYAGSGARELPKAGYRVFTSARGSQVTGVGVVKMTLLDAMGDMDNLPSVQIEHI